MKKQKRILVKRGSGNVFRDLGFPNPEREQLKAQLTLRIYRLIQDRGLTQAGAGKILGIQQPHVFCVDARAVGSFLGGAHPGFPHGARPGRSNHRKAYPTGTR
jgi:predicted XRE-type DNA-binding protein